MTLLRSVALLGAAVLVAVAAGLFLLGGELRGWSATAARHDARLLGERPDERAWASTPSVQARSARRLLGVEDDVRFRRALSRFRQGRPLAEGAGKGGDQVQATLDAESLLGVVERDDRNAERRSRAANMLGILDFEDSLYDKQNENAHLEKSLSEFRSAIRLDAGDAEARFNLELLLRLLKPKAGAGGAATSSAGLGTGAKGAGFSRPGQGY